MATTATAPKSAKRTKVAGKKTAGKRTTKKANKKKATKKAIKKWPANSNGEANAVATAVTNSSGGPNSQAEVHPDQKDLPNIDTGRISAIETVVKKIVEKKSQRKALKEEEDALIAKLPVLFKEHGLHQYSCHGKKVVIVPGADEVKIKKASNR